MSSCRATNAKPPEDVSPHCNMCSGWCTEYDSMLGRRYMHNKDCKKKPAMEEGHQ